VQANSGKILDAPDRCVFVDWTLGDIILQLRLNLSQTDIRSGSDLGRRIWPESQEDACDTLPTNSVAFYVKQRFG
jgi:hypothetical protein